MAKRQSTVSTLFPFTFYFLFFFSFIPEIYTPRGQSQNPKAPGSSGPADIGQRGRFTRPPPDCPPGRRTFLGVESLYITPPYTKSKYNISSSPSKQSTIVTIHHVSSWITSHRRRAYGYRESINHISVVRSTLLSHRYWPHVIIRVNTQPVSPHRVNPSPTRKYVSSLSPPQGKIEVTDDLRCQPRSV